MVTAITVTTMVVILTLGARLDDVTECRKVNENLYSLLIAQHGTIFPFSIVNGLLIHS
jgi:hypothetical protein